MSGIEFVKEDNMATFDTYIRALRDLVNICKELGFPAKDVANDLTVLLNAGKGDESFRSIKTVLYKRH